jgi:hypothetical protein
VRFVSHDKIEKSNYSARYSREAAEDPIFTIKDKCLIIEQWKSLKLHFGRNRAAQKSHL